MDSQQQDRRFRLQLVHAALAAAVGLGSVTCSDRPPVAPGGVTPGHAAFSLNPSFAAIPAGGPTIRLGALHAVLVSATGDTIERQTSFAGDSAVLTFEVPITGAEAVFTLDLIAFDAQGDTAFTSHQQITLHPGDNPTPDSPVLVYAGPDANVAAIRITPTSVVLPALQTATLTAAGTTSAGDPVLSLRVGWSSKDPSVATVDESGVVKAGQSQGSTTIVARTATGVSDSIQVQVHAPVSEVVTTPATLQLARGTSGTVTAELRDATGHVIDDRVATWTSSNPEIATVSADGAVTAAQIGVATLTASAEGKSGTVAVTVISPVDHIELTPAALQFGTFGRSIPLVAKVVPADGATADGITPTFSSSAPAVATVNASGVVTAVANGTATITAKVDTVTASVTATVLQVAGSVVVTPGSVHLALVGDGATLTAKVLDSLAHPLTAPVVEWTSADPAVASVAGTGLTATVTALHSGAARIIATAGTHADTTSVTVAPQIAKLIIIPSQSTIPLGGSVVLSAQFADEDDNLLGDAPTVYSTTTPSIVVLDSNVVIGSDAGVAHIEATSGSFTGSLDIPVVVPPPQMVVLGDVDMLTNGAFDVPGANQGTFINNLVNYSAPGPRQFAFGLVVYTGHGSLCASTGTCAPEALTAFDNAVNLNELSVFLGSDTTGVPLSSGVDPDVRVIVLFTPTVQFNHDEIATLSQFAAEGGRIIFVGDEGSAYGPSIDVENQLLDHLGSPLRANASDLVCAPEAFTLLPTSSLPGDPITLDVTGLAVKCSSDLTLGSGDLPGFYDPAHTHVLGAVTKLSLPSLPSGRVPVHRKP